MKIAVITVTLHAPWVRSLKEKRSEVKSMLAKLRNKFNVSAAETHEQNVHQTIVLSIAAIVANSAQASNVINTLIDFVEENSEASLVSIEQSVL